MEAALPDLLTYAELLARPRAKADQRLAYGAEALQFGELWLPKGPGSHPVVALIHGGCWLAELPGLELMDQAAATLRGAGYVVWNLEYRRIGHPGGGYPGTFEDIAAGIDHLRALAGPHRLDLDRVVSVGHSAGGHLAAWAAGRRRLPAASPLATPNPLALRGIVSLAGILDLAAYRQTGPDACGGPPTIDAITGAAERRDDPFADTSPAALLPFGVPQAVIGGALDPIVPLSFARAFAERARALGDAVNYVERLEAGHFELIDPTAAAWPEILAAIDRLARS
jgi:acetyl esterase/lipase